MLMTSIDAYADVAITSMYVCRDYSNIWKYPKLSQSYLSTVKHPIKTKLSITTYNTSYT